MRTVDVKRFPFQDSSCANDGISTPDDARVWSNAEARFYAEALATSDYADTVGSALKALLGDIPSLLDVGAGSGVLGRMLAGRDGRWTAVEPNRFMAHTLAAGRRPPNRIVRDVWRNLDRHEDMVHDTVLAANVGGPLDCATEFVRALRPLAARQLCWTVSAQQGPRRYCLSGFLPPELHGEDETPAFEIALEKLGNKLAPDHIAFVDWTFRAVFPSPGEAEEHFAARFPADDPAYRGTLADWITHRLKLTSTGWVAQAKKSTAILLWRN